MKLLWSNYTDILNLNAERGNKMNGLGQSLPHTHMHVIQGWQLYDTIGCALPRRLSPAYNTAGPLSTGSWCALGSAVLAATVGLLGVHAGYRKLLGRQSTMKWLVV